MLISNGLFTLAQLQTLGGVIGGQATGGTAPLALAPPNAIGGAWLKTFDLSFSWAYRFRDRLELRPGVSVFNLFNFANFSLPPNTLSPYLTNTPGSINGTTYNQQANVRVGVGTGVYGLGSPRTVEFGLRLTF